MTATGTILYKAGSPEANALDAAGFTDPSKSSVTASGVAFGPVLGPTGGQQGKLWRDTLQKGSFRGVPFEWTRSDLEFGRYTVTHTFPKRSRAEREDMMRRERDFSLELLVTSTTPGALDYATGRDKLIAAIEAPGTGQLVHPLFGNRTVAVLRARVAETVEEGGVARFMVTFGEDRGAEFTPAEATARADTKKAVDKAADQSIAASIRAFAAKLSIAGLSQTFQSLTGGDVGGAIGWMKDAIGQGQAIAGAVGQVVGAVTQDANSVIGWVSGANFLSAGAGLGGVTALLGFPGQLGAAIASQVAGLSFTGGLASLSNPIDDFWAGLTGPTPDPSPSAQPIGSVAPAPAQPVASASYSSSSAGTVVAVSDLIPGTVPQITAIMAGSATFPASLAPAPGWDPAAAPPLLTVITSAGTALPPADWAAIRAGAYAPETIAGVAQLQNRVALYQALIPYSPAAPTPARAQAIANATAVQDLVRQQALVQVAQATVAATYASSQAAQTARDAIAAALDTVAASATDPTVCATFAALRVAVIVDLTQTAMRLPNLRTYTPRATVPVLALAHRLYDDPALADDIVARNDIPHPLFVPGGVALEVLAVG